MPPKRVYTEEERIQARQEIFFWLLVMVAVAFVLGIAGYLVYRRLRAANQERTEQSGFSLSEMRRLYEAGEMSHEEYMQVRGKIVSATRKSILGDDPSLAPPAPGPVRPPNVGIQEMGPVEETDPGGPAPADEEDGPPEKPQRPPDPPDQPPA